MSSFSWVFYSGCRRVGDEHRDLAITSLLAVLGVGREHVDTTLVPGSSFLAGRQSSLGFPWLWAVLDKHRGVGNKVVVPTRVGGRTTF